MVVSIGMRLQEGPWGGGNQFGVALSAYLQARGVAVEFDLKRPDIDIILLTEPRRELQSCAYDDREIAAYRATVNPGVLVVHRVNECDERKGTTGVNARLREANRVADATVFISSWLMNLHVNQGMDAPERRVILNGADTTLFHSRGGQRWKREGPLRLVTHHWGANRQKGFDTYERLDEMLAEPSVGERLTFAYVGNLPAGVNLRHTAVRTPLHGAALADELRSHHVYVTGSENEPAGMHHIEGAACGLPLLYKRSGALPEYCSNFGVGFNGDDFPDALRQMIATYHVWVDRVSSYPHSAERMSEQYLALFTALLQEKRGNVPPRTMGKQSGPPTAPHSVGTALSVWAKKVVNGLPSFVTRLRDSSQPIRYSPATEGVLPAGGHLSLGFTALAIKLHVILGTWRTMSPEERLLHSEFLKSFQRDESAQNGEWAPGAFVDPPLVRYLTAEARAANVRLPHVRDVIRAESKQAIASLAGVNASPRRRYVDLPATASGVCAFLAQLDWRKPWEAGGHASALVTLLATGHGSAPVEMEEELLGAARQFFRGLLDPVAGGYFSGPRPDHGDLINGAMKVLTALDWLREPIHAPEALIDTCLSSLPQHEGCHLVDTAYVLYRCSGQTPHRSNDVGEYAKQLLEMIRLHHNADGGFSYWVGKSQTVYYGVPITLGMPVSDIHGTVLLTWAMAMVMRLMKDEQLPVLSAIQP